METMKTWYCNGGHNVFDSDQYSCAEPPECGACGAVMTTDSEGFEDTMEYLEILGITAFERQEELKKLG